ncbi:unnamed protein product, partial [Amoebophrya sp. A25]
LCLCGAADRNIAVTRTEVGSSITKLFHRIKFDQRRSCEKLRTIQDLQQVTSIVTERGAARPGLQQCDLPQSGLRTGPDVPAISSFSSYQKGLSPMGRINSVILVRLPNYYSTPAADMSSQEVKLLYPRCLDADLENPRLGNPHKFTNAREDDLARRQRKLARATCETFQRAQRMRYFSARTNTDMDRLDPVTPLVTFVFYDAQKLLPKDQIPESKKREKSEAEGGEQLFPQEHQNFFACLRFFCDAGISKLAAEMVAEEDRDETDDGVVVTDSRPIWDKRIKKEADYYDGKRGFVHFVQKERLTKMSPSARAAAETNPLDFSGRWVKNIWAAVVGTNPDDPNQSIFSLDSSPEATRGPWDFDLAQRDDDFDSIPGEGRGTTSNGDGSEAGEEAEGAGDKRGGGTSDGGESRKREGVDEEG